MKSKRSEMFISVGLLTTLSELKHQWKISAHVRVRPHPSPTPPPNKCRQQGSCPVTIVLSKSNLLKVGNMSCMKLNLVILKWSGSTLIHLMLLIL